MNRKPETMRTFLRGNVWERDVKYEKEKSKDSIADRRDRNFKRKHCSIGRGIFHFKC